MERHENKWDLAIKPKSRWFEINLRELWRYKELIVLFVKRDFVAFYKQTILGPLWYLIQPLVSAIAFTVIFGRIAKIPTDGIPDLLFYLSGIVCWGYFSDALINTSNTFVQNSHIFSKIYFPRLVVPISVVTSSMIKLAIQLLLLCSVYIYFFLSGFAMKPSVYILLFPVLFLQMALLGLGCGILISSLTTKYRDLNFLVSFGMQLWMYATPIVYPVSQIPEKYRFLYNLNPMAAIVSNFRIILFGTGEIDVFASTVSIAITVLVLVSGVILFNRIEKTYLDTV